MALAKVMRCLRFLLSEVYYHLCNNRCGGVNGPARNQMRHLRQVGGVKEINSVEWDKDCRLNCWFSVSRHSK